MKKTLSILVLAAFLALVMGSCKTGEGCPAENNWEKNHQMGDKRKTPKSGLFGKKKGK